MQKDFGVKHVVNTSEENWKETMKQFSDELKPSVCLEAIAGDFTAQMFAFMGSGALILLYGGLSEKPVGGIDSLQMIY